MSSGKVLDHKRTSKGTFIGLDLGSAGVRAAEIDVNGAVSTLRRFAQVGLPPGAIVDGEVLNRDVVAESLRRLWEEGQFSSKKVIVGLSSQRVIVRRAEVPAMSPEDFRMALRFEAQDLLPIAIEEAALDFAMVDGIPMVDAATGNARMEILLAAAHLDVVRSHLAALDAAGLQAQAVDVVPLALLRGLGRSTSPASIEAVVSIGADLLTVAIRQGDTPCFTRTVNMGGSKITNSLASQLNVSGPEAEDLKRTPRGTSEVMIEDRVRSLVHEEIRPLLQEINSSLDFFLAQGDGRQLDRVWLTGGATMTKGLQVALGATLRGVPLSIVDPLARLAISPDLVFSDRLRHQTATQALTPIGLALWGAEPALRRINLLPPEIALARRRRAVTQVSAAAITVLAVALSGAVLLRDRQVTHVKATLTQVEQTNTVLQARVASLSSATNLQTEVEKQRGLATSALTDDIDWVTVLEEFSAGLPAHDWVSNIALEATPQGSATATTGGAPSFGTIELSMTGLDGHESVAQWLRAATSIPDISNVWVSGSTTSAQGTDSFTSTGSLTKAAESTRAAHLPGAK